jgi:hypothetical protein
MYYIRSVVVPAGGHLLFFDLIEEKRDFFIAQKKLLQSRAIICSIQTGTEKKPNDPFLKPS